MRNQSRALSRTVFEESVDMPVTAAINGEVGDLSEYSSAKICGRAPKVGTNSNIDLLFSSKQSKTSYAVNQYNTCSKKTCDFGISSFDEGSDEEPEEDEEDYKMKKIKKMTESQMKTMTTGDLTLIMSKGNSLYSLLLPYI